MSTTFTDLADKIGANPKAIRRVLTKIGAADSVAECHRCAGLGHMPAFAHVEGGVCFRCSGAKRDFPTKPTRAIIAAVDAALEDGRVAKWKRACVARRQTRNATTRVLAVWGATNVSAVNSTGWHDCVGKNTKLSAQNDKMCAAFDRVKVLSRAADGKIWRKTFTDDDALEIDQAVQSAIAEIPTHDLTMDEIAAEGWKEEDFTDHFGRARKRWKLRP